MGKKASFEGKFDLKRATLKATLRDVADAAGTSYAAVKRASARKLFNRRDLQSVIEYVNRTRKKKKLPELG